MLGVNGRLGRRMSGSIIFRAQPEDKSRENENDDAFFFPGQEEPLPELSQFPAPS